jgi:para-aminobenzoate synthetase component I
MHSVIRQFFSTISHQQSHAVLLDGNPGLPCATVVDPLNQWAIAGVLPRKVHRLHITDHTVVKNSVFAEWDAGLQQAAQRMYVGNPDLSQLPFSGGLLGVLGYGFGQWCDQALVGALDLRPPSPYPDVLLFDFQDIFLWRLPVLHGQLPQLTCLTPSSKRYQYYSQLWRSISQTIVDTPLFQAMTSLVNTKSLKHTTLAKAWTASLSPDRFTQAVEQLQHAIQQGDLYQANLSLQFTKPLHVTPLLLYEDLCQHNPSPFSGFVQSDSPDGGQQILVCNSPERLLRVSASGKVETRPIAGTRGRLADSTQDKALGEALKSHPKEQAEHRMLVDLARNDLGRFCLPGSVTVDALEGLERYSYVTHLVSNVCGQKRPEVGPLEMISAMFPAGTITGCPKVRSVQHLNKLEPVSRGWYTGSLGYIDARTGAMDWNIIIRSLYLQRLVKQPDLPYNGSLHAGAGIVADSVAGREYNECLKKAAALFGVIARHDSTPQPHQSLV